MTNRIDDLLEQLNEFESSQKVKSVTFSVRNSDTNLNGTEIVPVAKPSPHSERASTSEDDSLETDDGDLYYESDEELIQEDLDIEVPPLDTEVMEESLFVQCQNDFQLATLDDYKSHDGLMDALDKYMRKKSSATSASATSAEISPPVFTYFGGASAKEESAAVPKECTTGVLPLKDKVRIITPLSIPDGSDEEDNEPIMKRMSSSNYTQHLISKLNQANIRKITTKVYLGNEKSFQSKLITSLTTAGQIIHDMCPLEVATKCLFEYCSDTGIERPLRDWEIVTDVLSAWNTTSSNAIIVKEYKYRHTLMANNTQRRYPKIQGYLYLPLKPGKWSKRFCVLKHFNLCYYADGKDPLSETLFCDLSRYDIYTTTKPQRQAPTQYGFAIRSDMSESSHTTNNYLFFISVEKEERLNDWILALRLAKSERMLHLAIDPDESKDAYMSPLRATPDLATTMIQSPSQPNSQHQSLTPGSLLQQLEPTNIPKVKKIRSIKDPKKRRVKPLVIIK